MSQKDYQKVLDTKHLNADLKERSLRGGAVTLTTQALSFLIQLGSTMVLARILTPQDYGMMAMVVAITGFAGMFINLGLSTATIQQAEINHAQVSTLFWINAGVGAVVMLLLACLSPFIALFYKTPELTWVTMVLSCNFLINGLAVQHQALLNRQMRFLAIAVVQVGAMLTGIGVAIIAAIKGYGYWTLVFNSITVSVCTVVGTWFASGWIPGLPRRDVNVLSMVKFGSDIVGFNVVNYFARNLDNVLIGRYYGSASLGLYSKAYQLLMMPITNLRDPMTKVAMPALSRLQYQPEKYRKYYMKYISVLAFISMPLVMFLFVCSDQIIGLLLGPNWMGASGLFKILAVAAFIQPASTTWGLVMLSVGKSKRYFRWGVVNSIAIVTSFFAGLPWGAKGIAISYAVATYFLLYPTLIYAFKDTPVKPSDFFLVIWKPVIGCLSMGGGCIILLRNLHHIPDIAILMICLAMSLIIYVFFFVAVSGGLQDLREYFSYGRLIFAKK